MEKKAINLPVLKTVINIVRYLFKDLKRNVNRNTVIGFFLYAFSMLYFLGVVDRIIISNISRINPLLVAMGISWIITLVLIIIVSKNTFISVAQDYSMAQNIPFKLNKYKIQQYTYASFLLFTMSFILVWFLGAEINSLIFFVLAFWNLFIPAFMLFEEHNNTLGEIICAIAKATYGYNLRIIAISFLVMMIFFVLYIVINTPYMYTVFVVMSTNARDATPGLVFYVGCITNVFLGLVVGVIYARLSFVLYMIFRDRILNLLKENQC